MRFLPRDLLKYMYICLCTEVVVTEVFYIFLEIDMETDIHLILVTIQTLFNYIHMELNL